MKERQIVQSVERALDILNCFSIDEPELTINDIMKKTGLTKTTVFRLLDTLKYKNFIERDESKLTYRLGMQLLRLGHAAKETIDIRNEALPIMEYLSKQTGQTISLNIVYDQHRICIEKIDGTSEIREIIKLGYPYLIVKGASGKVLLAHMDQETVDKIIQNLENEEINRKKLLEELKKIKKAGYAYSVNERINGAFAISAPIFGSDHKLLAGISISGFAIDLQEQDIKQYKQLILEKSKALSIKLGYTEKPYGDQ